MPAPIWAEVVAYLHHNHVSKAPAAPERIGQRLVQFETQASRAQKLEWFLPGTEREVVRVDDVASAQARITHPVSGTILALDPDIPPERQKLVFRASGQQSALSWASGRRGAAGWKYLVAPAWPPRRQSAQSGWCTARKSLGRGSGCPGKARA